MLLKRLLGLVCAFCVSAPLLAASTPEVLNITYVKAPFNIQCMVMKEHRLLEKEFEKEGMRINWIPIKAGLHQVRGMMAGDIDMASAMNTSTLLIANSAGNRIDIVGGVAHPDETFALVADPKKVKTMADLKGKTVVGPKGTVLHHMLTLALDRSQMTISDVNFMSMTLPASLTTLFAGKADAALVAANGLLKAKEQGFVPLASAKDFLSTNLVLTAREDFVKKYPEVVRRVAKVNKEALNWANANREAAIALGAKEHSISIKEATQLFEWSSFYSELTEKDIEALKENQAFLLKERMMLKPINVQMLVYANGES